MQKKMSVIWYIDFLKLIFVLSWLKWSPVFTKATRCFFGYVCEISLLQVVKSDANIVCKGMNNGAT